MEKIENIGFGGLKLIQDDDCFKFGVDAIILADFANSFCPQAKTVVDFGTGNGIIPLVLSHKNPQCHITGIDVQAKSIDMAIRSAAINELDNRLTFIRCDVKDAESIDAIHSKVDMVVSNPPYVARGGGIMNGGQAKYIARHETTATLDDFAKAAAAIIRDKGHICMVHRPSRLVDIFCSFRKYGIEPKDIRFVTPKKGEIPTMVLVHGVKGGGAELKFSEELPVRNEDGEYTAEIQRIYEK